MSGVAVKSAEVATFDGDLARVLRCAIIVSDLSNYSSIEFDMRLILTTIILTILAQPAAAISVENMMPLCTN